jgi:hypothetical protein
MHRMMNICFYYAFLFFSTSSAVIYRKEIAFCESVVLVLFAKSRVVRAVLSLFIVMHFVQCVVF